MGSATGSKQEITAKVHQRQLEINITDTDACETQIRRGPGVGDVIIWLQGARLVWSTTAPHPAGAARSRRRCLQVGLGGASSVVRAAASRGAGRALASRRLAASTRHRRLRARRPAGTA
jgi:hypothetical protein